MEKLQQLYDFTVGFVKTGVELLEALVDAAKAFASILKGIAEFFHTLGS